MGHGTARDCHQRQAQECELHLFPPSCYLCWLLLCPVPASFPVDSTSILSKVHLSFLKYFNPLKSTFFLSKVPLSSKKHIHVSSEKCIVLLKKSIFALKSTLIFEKKTFILYEKRRTYMKVIVVDYRMRVSG